MDIKLHKCRVPTSIPNGSFTLLIFLVAITPEEDTPLTAAVCEH